VSKDSQVGDKAPARGKASIGGRARQRRAARIAAVQALYQIEIAGTDSNEVMLEFLEHRLDEDMEGGFKLGKIDRELFADLIKEVGPKISDLDDMVNAVIAEDWSVDRLDTLLLIILRAGVFELAYRQDVPAKAVVNEYVDIAHGFFVGKEPNMANGMLNQIARSLRPDEFDES
jgi:N utilization substance protein B